MLRDPRIAKEVMRFMVTEPHESLPTLEKIGLRLLIDELDLLELA
jgi:hypothetical protein